MKVLILLLLSMGTMDSQKLYLINGLGVWYTLMSGRHWHGVQLPTGPRGCTGFDLLPQLFNSVSWSGEGTTLKTS